jgi:hypothetical protein
MALQQIASQIPPPLPKKQKGQQPTKRPGLCKLHANIFSRPLVLVLMCGVGGGGGALLAESAVYIDREVAGLWHICVLWVCGTAAEC